VSPFANSNHEDLGECAKVIDVIAESKNAPFIMEVASEAAFDAALIDCVLKNLTGRVAGYSAGRIHGRNYTADIPLALSLSPVAARLGYSLFNVTLLSLTVAR
jgi:hypothetical protein